jgi:hypothetical protein
VRRAAKRDTSEAAIVAEWERLGAHSEAVSDRGFPDRVVFYRGQTYLAETKTGKRGLTKAQVETFARLDAHGVDVFVIRTPEAARAMLRGELQPWSPTPAQQLANAVKRRPKPKAFRPGYSRARTSDEMCAEPLCVRSALPLKAKCHEHA